MCGRGKLTAPPEELRRLFGVDEIDVEPHFNISPTQPIAVIRDPARLEQLKFGLVPSWSREPKTKWINARSETVAKQGAFKSLLQTRRCLVVVDGFYEWESKGKKKFPYLLHLPNDEPFALAGLWDRWTSRDGEVVESCVVLTMEARPPVRALHDRMPLILAASSYDAWLDPAAAHPEQLLSDARGHSFPLLARRVNEAVNNPRNDDELCVAPPSPPTEDRRASSGERFP